MLRGVIDRVTVHAWAGACTREVAELTLAPVRYQRKGEKFDTDTGRNNEHPIRGRDRGIVGWSRSFRRRGHRDRVAVHTRFRPCVLGLCVTRIPYRGCDWLVLGPKRFGCGAQCTSGWQWRRKERL